MDTDYKKADERFAALMVVDEVLDTFPSRPSAINLLYELLCRGWELKPVEVADD